MNLLRWRLVLPGGLVQPIYLSSPPSTVGSLARRQRWDLLSAGRRPRWQPLAQRCGRPLKRCRAKKRAAHMHIGSLDHLFFQWSWQRCSRTPDVMITDGFPEFRGDFFVQSGAYDGILQVIVDADAPWQNGKYEKHGGLVKDLLAKGLETGVVITPDNLEDLLGEIVSLRNRRGIQGQGSARVPSWGSQS